MLRALDEAPINRRYVILMLACMVGAVLDLFDFFLIAFVVPILNDEWSLTFGEATAMLLSAGFGAILGSIIWGRLGESHGRRRPLIAGLLIFSLGTGAMALAPDEGWWFITIFRFIVGAGSGGRRGDRGADGARVHPHAAAHADRRLRHHGDGADRDPHGRGRRPPRSIRTGARCSCSGCCR